LEKIFLLDFVVFCEVGEGVMDSKTAMLSIGEAHGEGVIGKINLAVFVAGVWDRG
jgi:hypothetical protein